MLRPSPVQPIQYGVPAELILVLDEPLDTAQEARAVRAALGGGSPLILVTSAAHMPRAMRHFQAVGLDPIPAPTQYLTGRGDRPPCWAGCRRRRACVRARRPGMSTWGCWPGGGIIRD